MFQASRLFFLIWLDIKRVFRDTKYVLFIITLPVIFYIIYTAIFPKNANVNDVPWSEYCLISMIAFGIMGNAINLLGTKIADERKKKWYTYLRVSPVNSIYYVISHVFSYLLISVAFTFLMFVVAYLYKGINLGVLETINIGITLNIGSVVFLIMALLIGRLDSLSQPIGTITYLVLSFLGGLWMPVAAMPKFLSQIATFLPSYNYARLGWRLLENKGIDVRSVTILFIYIICFLGIYILLQRKEQAN